MSGNGVTIHFFVLSRTQNWLKASGADRRDELRRWALQLQPTGASYVVDDEKGAILRFVGGDAALRKVREWASAHPRTVRVLP